MVSGDSRTYNDPRDPKYRAYEEARKRQAAQAQRRAREEARLQAERKKQEWREEAERSQRMRRQRAQQQLQDKSYRSRFADVPQSHDEIRERRQQYEQAQRLHQQRAREQRAAHQRELLERQREYERSASTREHVADEFVRGRFAQSPQARADDRNRRISQERQVAREEQLQEERQLEAMRQQEEAARRAEEQRREATAYSDRQLTVQQRQAAQRRAQQPSQQMAAQQQEQILAQRRAEQARAMQERKALEQQYLEKMARKRAEEEPDAYVEKAAHHEADTYGADTYVTGVQAAIGLDDFHVPANTGAVSGPSSSYSRDTYTRDGHKSGGMGMRDRLSSLRGGEDGGEFRPSKKLIAILVAIFAVVVILFIVNPMGCGDSKPASKGSSSASSVATPVEPSLPTPIMSESAGVLMHSAVPMEFLTEILIHNASFGYANEINTKLVEATNTDIIAAHGTGRVAANQPTGDEWMTGEFIRCFRSGNAGPIMSAIDCGGPVGTTVYAPVTGTVVLVKEYKLYNEIDDFRVHIQPEGRPDLDVVLIHLTDVTVKAGDPVVGGVTPIGSIRDVEQYLGDSMQLKQYTAVEDMGNHTHIQVNNVNDPEYHGLDDLKPDAAADAQTGDSQIDS